jgi:hypothetical protein
MVERLEPGLAGYLMTNRAFVAPAVAEAVASLGLRAGSRVLDAGTGAGGALPALAHAVALRGTYWPSISTRPSPLWPGNTPRMRVSSNA